MIAEAGLLSVALVVAQQSQILNPSGAPPLAGSLPYSVRTFLSRLSPAATARPVLLQGEGDYSKRVFNGLQSAIKDTELKLI